MKIFLALLLLLSYSLASGQEPVYSYYYRVYFRDKGENNTGSFTAEELLSSRAIQRREKAGILAPDNRDIPVSADYIARVSSAGYQLHCTSKWMNTALFKTRSMADISKLLELPFVSNVKIVRRPGTKNLYGKKLDIQKGNGDSFPFDRPVTMVNGKPLHEAGYNGKGILIAVLDGGFINADQLSSLNELTSRNGITSTYDFVRNDISVYKSATHGTAVLSILAGNITGMLEGTAQGADFLLLITEDVGSEFPCEEDYWAAGAEYADSAGADIISSSLGYFTFDDPSLDYRYSDMDGNTAFITRAADIAASKGILVVNSAGNERDNEWKHIIFPADGDSVMAIGAVDGNSNISVFSSAGPSFDRRIKPDNAAMGVSVPLQVTNAEVSRSSGTSFSCPVFCGMAACLMQAVPKARNTDIIKALHESGDRYNTPDSLYGYGVPEMVAALKTLQDKYLIIPEKFSLASPNPTTGNVDITFREEPGELSVEIISPDGKLIRKNKYAGFPGRILSITDLQNMPPGIYFIRLKNASGTRVHKIIKTGK